MAESFVQLPDDAANIGKKVRSNTRTVGANSVHEHSFHKAGCETSAVANVAISATNVTLRSASQARTGLVIQNDGDIETLYVKLGATASVTSFSRALLPGETWELVVPYAGIVDGIWSGVLGVARGGGSPAARVTEVTP